MRTFSTHRIYIFNILVCTQFQVESLTIFIFKDQNNLKERPRLSVIGHWYFILFTCAVIPNQELSVVPESKSARHISRHDKEKPSLLYHGNQIFTVERSPSFRIIILPRHGATLCSRQA